MTSPEQSVEASFVVGPGDPRDRDAAVVGAKAANLARLAASGFRVPEGFVITAAGCDRILTAPDIADEVWAEIRSHRDQLGDGPLAVRSSGTLEDLDDASYAGQYETVLEVEGHDALTRAVGRCLASASSDRVRAYSRSDARAPMAVLIQRMVPAEAAGVAFTANPVTGDDEVLVSAVKGLGDRLVSGEATPDEWVARGDDVTCVRAPEGAIDQNQAREIAVLARAVERLFGSPQDIEWAVAGGHAFVLQARPITALPVAPRLEAPSEGFWQKDTSHWPTPITPFGASVYMPALSDSKPPMAEFGLMIDGLEQRSLGGEVYVRVIPLGGKERPAPPSWAVWLGVRLAPPLRRRARAAEAALASGLAERILDSWEGEWRAAFAREFRELRNVDLATLADEALLAHLDCVRDMFRRGVDLHFRLVAPYDLALYELGVVCQDLLGWEVVRALSLVAGTSVASSEPGRELRALAKRVAADPPALQALTEPGGDRLASLRRSAPWAAEALDEYLERFGHRTLNYDPGEPTWFERPDMVTGLLAEQARQTGTDPGEAPGQPDALAQARAELAGRSEEDRARFETALAYAGRAYAQREDNIVWLDNQPSALLRYCAVEIGRRLVDRGVLAHASDAVFLDEAELRGALSRGDSEDLRGLVARRKAERAWVAAHPGPLSYGKDPGPPPKLSVLPPALRLVHAALFQSLQFMLAPNTPQDSPNRLRGVPGSPGRHSGTVRVVRDETEFAKLGPGDVLVAPVTSPPWSVLFLQAGAVVTDGGGVLSHTAVVAREYGIPAVLATGEATRRLCDGDFVDVDGTTGIVSIGQQAVASVDRTSTQSQ
jgi:rifampicin phosphotransferase